MNLDTTNRVLFARSFTSHFKKGVEVGCRKCAYAEQILINCPSLDSLVCIDPFTYNAELEDPDASRNTAFHTVNKYAPRATILIGESPNISDKFEDESQDFVYIDALHDYESVKSDIEAWYPKVKTGGILYGHDYNPVKWSGVVKAVQEFTAHHGYAVNLISVSNPYNHDLDQGEQSWFIVKGNKC